MKSGWEPVVPYIGTDAWHIYWLGRMAALIQLTTQSWLENQLWTFHALPKHWSLLGLTGSQVLLKAWKFEASRARKNYTQFCKISKAQNPLTDTLCAQSKALQKSLTASSFSSMVPLRMAIGLMGMIVLIPSVLLPSILAEGMHFWLVWYWCFLRRLYLPIYTTKIMQKQASKNVSPVHGQEPEWNSVSVQPCLTAIEPCSPSKRQLARSFDLSHVQSGPVVLQVDWRCFALLGLAFLGFVLSFDTWILHRVKNKNQWLCRCPLRVHPFVVGDIHLHLKGWSGQVQGQERRFQHLAAATMVPYTDTWNALTIFFYDNIASPASCSSNKISSKLATVSRLLRAAKWSGTVFLSTSSKLWPETTNDTQRPVASRITSAASWEGVWVWKHKEIMIIVCLSWEATECSRNNFQFWDEQLVRPSTRPLQN